MDLDALLILPNISLMFLVSIKIHGCKSTKNYWGFSLNFFVFLFPDVFMLRVSLTIVSRGGDSVTNLLIYLFNASGYYEELFYLGNLRPFR